MRWITGLFAACTVLAGISTAAGNPTGPSGVVGAGLCTVICFALALIEGRP